MWRYSTVTKPQPVPDTIDRYKVLRRLALGRESDVVLASTPLSNGGDRSVVVKSLLPQVAASGDCVRRFLHEERVTASLSHPHLSRLTDSGGRGRRFFMALAHVPGRTTRELLSSCQRGGWVFPVDVAISLVRDACAGLDHLHTNHRLVHREVVPSNLLVDESGQLVVVDFGSALEPGGRAERLRRATRYAPPELIRHTPADESADVYGLGVVLYEMTTGRNPFAGADPLARICAGRVRRPTEFAPGFPADLEALVLRAMAPEPANRFRSVGDLHEALDSVARSLGIVPSSRRVASFIRTLSQPRAAQTPATPVQVGQAGGRPDPFFALGSVSRQRPDAVNRAPTPAGSPLPARLPQPTLSPRKTHSRVRPRSSLRSGQRRRPATENSRTRIRVKRGRSAM